MSKPFTKLEKIIEQLFYPNLKLKIKCFSYTAGKNAIPRFYLQLDKEIIWDFPKDFEIKEIPFYSWADDNHISELIREYIDTPLDELLNKEFKLEKVSFINHGNYDGNAKEYNIDYKLTELFKAADRRLGKEKLLSWHKKINNSKVDLILLKRFGMDFTIQLTFKERARIAMELLSKQPPITLEMAIAQVAWLNSHRSNTDIKRKGE
jgi:hypothetical protein